MFVVSIQLLLLFYILHLFNSFRFLCFNTTLVTVLYSSFNSKSYGGNRFQYNSCYCSILSYCNSKSFISKFQYNSCYCSIIVLAMRSYVVMCFNTTLVTVLFKAVNGYTIYLAKFQYNSCYCSIHT